jgi:hypothetical protein
MIRLTKQQAEKIGYLKINNWYAIQPIELKDGTFILPERVRGDIEKFLEKDIPNKTVIQKTLTDIKKYPIRKLDKSELKDAEIIDDNITKPITK